MFCRSNRAEGEDGLEHREETEEEEEEEEEEQEQNERQSSSWSGQANPLRQSSMDKRNDDAEGERPFMAALEQRRSLGRDIDIEGKEPSPAEPSPESSSNMDKRNDDVHGEGERSSMEDMEGKEPSPAEPSPESSNKKERVVVLRKVLRVKREYDGFGGLLWFVIYSCISGIIPALLMDFYDGVYRSRINEDLSSFSSYAGDDW